MKTYKVVGELPLRFKDLGDIKIGEEFTKDLRPEDEEFLMNAGHIAEVTPPITRRGEEGPSLPGQEEKPSLPGQEKPSPLPGQEVRPQPPVAEVKPSLPGEDAAPKTPTGRQ